MDEDYYRNSKCFNCLGASFGDCKICFERDAEKEKRDSRKREHTDKDKGRR